MRNINAKLLAGAMALALASVPVPPSSAQPALQLDARVGFNEFYVALRPYGHWFHHARWGDVWQPEVANFRPYWEGHWDYTDVYGWVWVSDYSWGDIPFHYGRWVYDPNDGWLWIPGYIWAPAWVLWRYGDGYVGWFPMPPDSEFLAGAEVYPANWNDADRAYGYMDWYGPNYGPDWFATDWVFVNTAHFADRDYHRYAVEGGAQAMRLFRQTRDSTHYATANNFVVNRSVDPALISRARGRPVTPVPLRQVIRANAPVAPVDIGRDVQQTERRSHGGNPQAPATARAEPFNSATAGPPGRPERENRGSPNREFAQPAPGRGTAPGAPPPEVRQREAVTPPQGQRGSAPAAPERRGRVAGPQQAIEGPPPGFAPGPRERSQGGQRPGPFEAPPTAGPPAPPPGFAGGPRERGQGAQRQAPFEAPQTAGPPAPPPGFAGGPRERGQGAQRQAPFEAPQTAGPPAPPPGFAGGQREGRAPFQSPPAAPPPQFAFGQGRRGGGPSGAPPGLAPNAGGPPRGAPGPQGGPHGQAGPPPGPPPGAGAQPAGGGGQPERGGGKGRDHEH